jgi:hypothetical protein
MKHKRLGIGNGASKLLASARMQVHLETGNYTDTGGKCSCVYLPNSVWVLNAAAAGLGSNY